MRYLAIILLLALQFLSNAWAHFDPVGVAKVKCFSPSLDVTPDYTYYGYGKKKPLPKTTAGDVACFIRDLKRVERKRQKLAGTKVKAVGAAAIMPPDLGRSWTQTLAWIDNVLEASPHLFVNQAVLHANFRAQATPEGKLNYLKTAYVGGKTFLRALFDQIYGFMTDVSGANKHNQCNVLEKALEEEIKHKNHFVVYRASGSEDKFCRDIYEHVLSVFNMRKGVKGIRIVSDLQKKIADFYREFDMSGQQDDNYKPFGKYAVSGSLSLLDAGAWESALYFYGKNTQTVNFNSFDFLDRITDAVHMQKSHKLHTKLYNLFNKGIELSKTNNGNVHLLQFFIPQDLTDTLIWTCKPYGKKKDFASTKDQLEDLVTNPSNFTHTRNRDWSHLMGGYNKFSAFNQFQARLFIAHPEFFNPRRVISKFYGQQGVTEKTSKEYRAVLREISKILVSSYMEQLESRASLANDHQRLFNIHIDHVGLGAGGNRSALASLYGAMSQTEIEIICTNYSKAQQLFDDNSWQSNAVLRKKVGASIETAARRLSSLHPDSIRAQFLAAGELCSLLAGVWDDIETERSKTTKGKEFNYKNWGGNQYGYNKYNKPKSAFDLAKNGTKKPANNNKASAFKVVKAPVVKKAANSNKKLRLINAQKQAKKILLQAATKIKKIKNKSQRAKILKAAKQKAALIVKKARMAA